MGCTSSSNQHNEKALVVPKAGFVIKSKSESGIKVFINVQHYDHGGPSPDKKTILAFMDKKSCHDKKDSEAIYYGVVISSTSFSAINLEDLKSLQWIVKEINRNFHVSLDTVTYSIPKIAKCFVGDTIDSVYIEVRHVHSPTEINVSPSVEESKVESTTEIEVQHHESNPLVDEVTPHETEVKTQDSHELPAAVAHQEAANPVEAEVHAAPVPHIHHHTNEVEAEVHAAPVPHIDHHTAAIHAPATPSTTSHPEEVPVNVSVPVSGPVPVPVPMPTQDHHKQPTAEKVEHVAAPEKTTTEPLPKSAPSSSAAVESTPAVEVPVMLRGWARKQGHLVRSWKTRYFVLADGQLAYYADQRETQPFGADLKGRICLAGYRSAVDESAVEVDNKAEGFLGRVSRKVSVVQSQNSDSFKIILHKIDSSFNDYVAKNMPGVSHPDMFIMELENAALKNAWVSAIHSHAYYMEDIISEKNKK